MVAQRTGEFVVVVPVKPPAFGKSRLRGLTETQRRALAEAFALDTAAACLTTDRVGVVLVTTDDAAFAARLADLGCATMPDATTLGLNAVLGQSVVEAERRWPELAPVALCADLPALRPGDLDEALSAVSAVDSEGPWFVVDADGTGTTMYAAPAQGFDPHFGSGSRAAHLEAGAREIPGALPTLRRDVDDLTGLASAVGLGVGPATTRLMRSSPELPEMLALLG